MQTYSAIQFPPLSKMVCLCTSFLLFTNCQSPRLKQQTDAKFSNSRTRISINDDWRFMRYNGEPDKLMYDVRPEVADRNDSKLADSKPTDAVEVKATQEVLRNGFYLRAMIISKIQQKNIFVQQVIQAQISLL